VTNQLRNYSEEKIRTKVSQLSGGKDESSRLLPPEELPAESEK